MNTHRRHLRPLLALPLILGLAQAATAATAPADLEGRRQELIQATEVLKDWQSKVGPRLNAIVPLTRDYVNHLSAVQRLDFSTDERRALLAGDAGRVSADKRAVLEAAAPAFAPMKTALAAYFEAFDHYQAEEIRVRILGNNLQMLEKRATLNKYIGKNHARELDASVTRALEVEAKYREVYANQDAKNHHHTNAIEDAHEATAVADKEVDRFRRKYGLAKSVPWGKRIGDFFRSIKKVTRKARIYASMLPAVSRMFVHLYNPWRKTADPDKVSHLLRFFSKSYRWASGLELEVRGEENIPQGDAPIVFSLSHRSEIEDAVTMMAVVPDTFGFMVAQRAIPAFLNAKLVKQPSIINVGGVKEDGTVVDAVDDGIDTLKNGIDLAIFPEGTTPTEQRETWPLRSGIDVVTKAVSENPVWIVPISIDDPANGYGQIKQPSMEGKMKITVNIGKPIDPLKLKAVPGADKQLLLDTIRAIYHRNLFRRDIDIEPTESRVLGVLDGGKAEKFEGLHR